MAQHFDAIFVGAGHNALVCANYLARSGQSVLILERASEVGGLATPYEFKPGFRAPVAHGAHHFPQQIAEGLNLKEHGLELEPRPVRFTALSSDGHHVQVHGNAVEGVSQDDQNAYGRYLSMMEKYSAALAPSWLETMPRLGYHGIAGLMTFGRLGLNMKRLGKKDMGELLRVFTLPMRDLMDEHFENPLLKALLSWDGLIGSRMAPRSPNNAVPAVLYRMAGCESGVQAQLSGGVSNLIGALSAAAGSAGVEIRTMARVERIVMEANEAGLSASAVQLEDGSIISGTRIISSADPKSTFLNLVGVDNLEIGFTNRIRRMRSHGLVAKLHLALDGLPEFTGLDRPEGRILIAESMDHIEFAFDESKYGRYSESPVMEFALPTLEDPSLAPDGQHVLSAHVMYAPAELEGGWTFQARKTFADNAIAMLERYAPGLGQQIIGHELLTPADIESQFGLTGGHWHHGEFALDQLLMMRPTYEAAQYKTPIDGLWLCGAGCHPAGDLTGAPGHNAAQAILRDKSK